MDDTSKPVDTAGNGPVAEYPSGLTALPVSELKAAEIKAQAYPIENLKKELHDTPVNLQAKGKAQTARLWSYVRGERL